MLNHAKNPDRAARVARSHALRKFGLTEGSYEILLTRQGGCCDICKKPEKFKKRLAVDHDHATGKVRGLLCQDCNTSLGKFGDSVEILRNAVAYLEKQ